MAHSEFPIDFISPPLHPVRITYPDTRDGTSTLMKLMCSQLEHHARTHSMRVFFSEPSPYASQSLTHTHHMKSTISTTGV